MPSIIPLSLSLARSCDSHRALAELVSSILLFLFSPLVVYILKGSCWLFIFHLSVGWLGGKFSAADRTKGTE